MRLEPVAMMTRWASGTLTQTRWRPAEDFILKISKLTSSKEENILKNITWPEIWSSCFSSVFPNITDDVTPSAMSSADRGICSDRSCDRQIMWPCPGFKGHSTMCWWTACLSVCWTWCWTCKNRFEAVRKFKLINKYFNLTSNNQTELWHTHTLLYGHTTGRTLIRWSMVRSPPPTACTMKCVCFSFMFCEHQSEYIHLHSETVSPPEQLQIMNTHTH